MFALTTLFSLLTAAAGWYYSFYSRAAAGLGGIEDDRLNARRRRLRRLGGAVMCLLGLGLFVGFNTFDPMASPQSFLLVWAGVFGLVMAVVLLALVDLRLTWRLRHRPSRGFEVQPHEKGFGNSTRSPSGRG